MARDGLEQLQVDAASDESLLAFLHLSEKAAAGRFALYGQVLDGDPDTRTVFARRQRAERAVRRDGPADAGALEGLIAQLTWMRSLGGEGGLFVAIGAASRRA
jgi:hypothetical protein